MRLSGAVLGAPQKRVGDAEIHIRDARLAPPKTRHTHLSMCLRRCFLNHKYASETRNYAYPTRFCSTTNKRRRRRDARPRRSICPRQTLVGDALILVSEALALSTTKARRRHVHTRFQRALSPPEIRPQRQATTLSPTRLLSNECEVNDLYKRARPPIASGCPDRRALGGNTGAAHQSQWRHTDPRLGALCPMSEH